MGKIFNKGLSKDDNKKGLFKRLDNTKNKNEELINTISTINKALMLQLIKLLKIKQKFKVKT